MIKHQSSLGKVQPASPCGGLRSGTCGVHTTHQTRPEVSGFMGAKEGQQDRDDLHCSAFKCSFLKKILPEQWDV